MTIVQNDLSQLLDLRYEGGVSRDDTRHRLEGRYYEFNESATNCPLVGPDLKIMNDDSSLRRHFGKDGFKRSSAIWNGGRVIDEDQII